MNYLSVEVIQLLQIMDNKPVSSGSDFCLQQRKVLYMNSAVDLHIHTHASDGTDYPEALIQKLKERQIRTFAVTDHDTIDGVLEISPIVPEDMRFITGIEFSCVTSIGRVHILGYGFDPANPVFQAALEKGRQLRRQKLDLRLKYLMEECGVPISDIEIDAYHRMKSVGKPHLAQMLIQKGFAKDMDTAIRDYILPSDTEDLRITSAMAIGAIAEAGGFSVWAHPLGGEGEKKLNIDQCYAQLQELVRQGIRGMECYYSRYNEHQIRDLLRIAEAYKLRVSGGSDYHGTRKNIELGTLNAMGVPVEESRINILRMI